MIRFQLRCDGDDFFEAWFRGNADFEAQAGERLIACPACGSQEITKALMSPVVSASTRNSSVPAPAPQPAEAAASTPPAVPVATGVDPDVAKAIDLMQRMTRHVRANSDYVGPRFAEEARKIHYEEAPPRGIYGEATAGEIKELAEEGIGFHPLPILPEDRN